MWHACTDISEKTPAYKKYYGAKQVSLKRPYTLNGVNSKHRRHNLKPHKVRLWYGNFSENSHTKYNRNMLKRMGVRWNDGEDKERCHRNRLPPCGGIPLPSSRHFLRINLLNPTGHVMHQQFNIQQLYALPTLYLCVLYLSENKQRLVPLQHKLIGFYNRDEKCLLRGTNWVFK